MRRERLHVLQHQAQRHGPRLRVRGDGDRSAALLCRSTSTKRPPQNSGFAVKLRGVMGDSSAEVSATGALYQSHQHVVGVAF